MLKFLFLALVFAQSYGFSQTKVFIQACAPCGEYDFNYSSNLTELAISNISSNFDRRDLGNNPGSQWHRGIDYSPVNQDGDYGFKIKAINDFGRVLDIYIAESQGVGIFIGNANDNNSGYFYYHLFRNSNNTYKQECTNGIQVGAFVLKFLDGSSNKLSIINLDDQYAIGEIDGEVTYNGHTYQVFSNLYELKDIIGFSTPIFLDPIGKSQTNNAHLHIEYLNSSCGT